MDGSQLGFEFAASPSNSILQEIGRLRVEVWRKELVPGFFPDGVWLEPHDTTGLHWFVRDGGRIVAAARLNITNGIEDAVDGEAWLAAGRTVQGPVANLSRLVVLPSHEKTGLGKKLVLARVEKARQFGAGTCIGVAIGRPLERLLRLGFTRAPNVRVTKVERRIEFVGCELPLGASPTSA